MRTVPGHITHSDRFKLLRELPVELDLKPAAATFQRVLRRDMYVQRGRLDVGAVHGVRELEERCVGTSQVHTPIQKHCWYTS